MRYQALEVWVDFLSNPLYFRPYHFVATMASTSRK